MNVSVKTTFAQGAESFENEQTYSGDGYDQKGPITVGANSTQPFTLYLDVSELQAYVLSSNVPLTMKTNSESAPDDTISIPAGEPIIWPSYSDQVSDFTADVTGQAFLVNDTNSTATFNARFLSDVTPTTTTTTTTTTTSTTTTTTTTT